jgi:hypothetical protein
MNLKPRYVTMVFLLVSLGSLAQQDSSKRKAYKNVIRYNLSGAMLFGASKYVVFGYERVIRSNQSISVNVGRASLPKMVGLDLDSVSVQKDQARSGFNASVDYRFYLARENKFAAPRGLYIGPFYSYNHFTRDNTWTKRVGTGTSTIPTSSELNIHTVGFELGYQFILWKHLSIDLVLLGPGMGFYDYRSRFEGQVDEATRQQILDGLEKILVQKFPGMNYVFSGEEFDANGSIKTRSYGYRYIIHLGFNF